MNKDEKTTKMIEKFAAGLKRMKITPDAFLFCDADIGADDVVAESFRIEEFCGIQIYHSCHMMNTSTDDAVPFIPMWFKPDQDHIVERSRFNEGYGDY